MECDFNLQTKGQFDGLFFDSSAEQQEPFLGKLIYVPGNLITLEINCHNLPSNLTPGNMKSARFQGDLLQSPINSAFKNVTFGKVLNEDPFIPSNGHIRLFFNIALIGECHLNTNQNKFSHVKFRLKGMDKFLLTGYVETKSITEGSSYEALSHAELDDASYHICSEILSTSTILTYTKKQQSFVKIKSKDNTVNSVSFFLEKLYMIIRFFEFCSNSILPLSEVIFSHEDTQEKIFYTLLTVSNTTISSNYNFTLFYFEYIKNSFEHALKTWEKFYNEPFNLIKDLLWCELYLQESHSVQRFVLFTQVFEQWDCLWNNNGVSNYENKKRYKLFIQKYEFYIKKQLEELTHIFTEIVGADNTVENIDFLSKNLVEIRNCILHFRTAVNGKKPIYDSIIKNLPLAKLDNICSILNIIFRKAICHELNILLVSSAEKPNLCKEISIDF